MRFIRKNGRVIPIKDKAAGAAALGASGALAAHAVKTHKLASKANVRIKSVGAAAYKSDDLFRRHINTITRSGIKASTDKKARTLLKIKKQADSNLARITRKAASLSKRSKIAAGASLALAAAGTLLLSKKNRKDQ